MGSVSSLLLKWSHHYQWLPFTEIGPEKIHRKGKQGVETDFPGGPMAKTPGSQCRGPGFHPWAENCIPHDATARFRVPQWRGKIPHDATEAWHSQINKETNKRQKEKEPWRSLRVQKRKMVHMGRGVVCLNLEEQRCGLSLASRNARQWECLPPLRKCSQSYTWLSKLTVREILSSQPHLYTYQFTPHHNPSVHIDRYFSFSKKLHSNQPRTDGQIISKEKDVNSSHMEKHKKLWDVCLEILK